MMTLRCAAEMNRGGGSRDVHAVIVSCIDPVASMPSASACAPTIFDSVHHRHALMVRTLRASPTPDPPAAMGGRDVNADPRRHQMPRALADERTGLARRASR